MAGANLPNQGEGLLGPNSVAIVGASIMVYLSAKFGRGWDGGEVQVVPTWPVFHCEVSQITLRSSARAACNLLKSTSLILFVFNLVTSCPGIDFLTASPALEPLCKSNSY